MRSASSSVVTMKFAIAGLEPLLDALGIDVDAKNMQRRS